MQADDSGEVTEPPGKPLIGREQFAKISEVEGIRLNEEARRMFADFDRRKLSPEERRREIVERFRREAAE